MQLRLFRHFVPISVVLLVSSDALLITGAFYQMLSQSGTTNPLVFGVASLRAQLATGLSAAAVVTMISVGLYGEQSFVDFRQLLIKIAVAFVLFLILVVACTAYWREGLKDLPDPANLPLKATLIWLCCISLTRGTFLITLGRGVLKRRIAVLGNGAQAARIARLVERGQNQHFVPVSYIHMPGSGSAASPVPPPLTGPIPDPTLSLNSAVRLASVKSSWRPTTAAGSQSSNCCTASSLELASPNFSIFGNVKREPSISRHCVRAGYSIPMVFAAAPSTNSRSEFLT
jgi:hypothetical protein